jgi:hypothetical protein
VRQFMQQYAASTGHENIVIVAQDVFALSLDQEVEVVEVIARCDDCSVLRETGNIDRFWVDYILSQAGSN